LRWLAADFFTGAFNIHALLSCAYLSVS